MNDQYALIPDVMKDAKRWLVWKSIPNPDPSKKAIKKPFYVSGKPRSGTMDAPQDVAQFGTFEAAKQVLLSGKGTGLGFALGDGWQGIDLDHLSDHPELIIIKDELIAQTYCETSPNGDGIHAIGYGRDFATMGSTADGIEAYSHGRFFTVTGEALSIHDPIDLSGFVETDLRSRRAPKPVIDIETGDIQLGELVSAETITDLRSALLFMRADDRELWVRIGHALKPLGDIGRGLFMDWSCQSDKFDSYDASNKWDSFKPNHTSHPAVFKIAQGMGWINPRSNAAQGGLNGDSSHPIKIGDVGLYNLDKFALNGQSKELEDKLLDDKFILGRIAILGQATVIYAPPNTGKTLLMLAMLRDGIVSGEVDAPNVYFVNADDHFKGAVQKLKLAEKYGFKMLVPSHNDFKAEAMVGILKAQCISGKARGMVLILDTMKKFTDLMSKSKGTDFMKSVREFVSHGGSVILLAHTNKHRNDEGGLIYAGTADVVDDCDCAYTIDVVNADTSAGIKSVKFSNFKARGDNAIEEVYQYDITEGMSYEAKLESVRLMGAEEKQSAITRKAVDAMLERNGEAIKVIQDLIQNGTTKKTEIIKAAMAEGISKTKVIKALNDHGTGNQAGGQLWSVTIGTDNAHVYKLIL